MKKLLLIVLVTITHHLTASAYDCEIDDIYYNLLGTEATVTYKTTSYNSYSGNVSIPESITYGGTTFNVTCIGDYAFNKCTGLTSVDIPYSITSIGDAAFQGCSSLASITIPNSITSIGRYAFNGCKGLTSITIPSSVKSIKEATFMGCSSLASIIITDGLESIGEQAFYGCRIRSITIPKSVGYIGVGAFYGCISLSAVHIEDLSAWCNIRYGYASYWAEEMNYSSNPLYYAQRLFLGEELIRDLVIPEDVSFIKGYTFSTCLSLTSVSIPNSVKGISENAFYGCTNLTSVSIPNSVESIGRYAFSGCSLTSVILPDNITVISYSSFNDDCKLYANVGTSTLLALWGEDFSVYNFETDEKIQRPQLVFKNCTQSTLSFDVEPHYSDYTYKSNKGKLIADENHVVVSGLRPETSYYGGGDLVMMCCGRVNCAVKTTSNFRTANISPSVNSSQVTASSAQLNGSYVMGDAEVVSQTVQFGDVTQEGNEMMVVGLEPGRTYNAEYTIKVKYGKDGEYTYDYTSTCAVTTEVLTMKNLNPKNVKVGEAVVCAETNVSDRETNVGFEWRKTDAPETVPSKQGTAVIYDGVMEGYIKNLQTTSYYNVRPYYQSASGTMYYGEWIGVDPADYSYFAPTVHTYAYVDMVDGVPVLTGYVMDGSDDIVERGFEYWVSGTETKSRLKAEASSNVQTVVASGQKMTVALNNLIGGKTYICRAYAKTNAETFYGEDISFTTPLPTGIDEVQSTMTEAQNHDAVYDMQGRLVGKSLDGLPRGIYIKNGRKYWVK